MSRHLKVIGRLRKSLNSDIYDSVEVTVEEQTHFGHSFGMNSLHHTWSYGSLGFVHGELRIYSYSSKDAPYGFFSPTTEDHAAVTLWCNLLNTPNVAANRSFMASLEQWEMLKYAVEAYNEYFKEQG